MNKNILLAVCFIAFTMPSTAEEVFNAQALDYVNSNKNFSGVYNRAPKAEYPPLYKNTVQTERRTSDETKETKKTEIKKNINANSSGKKAPMTYGNFPQNHDSSYSQMLMQQGMQGMIDGGMFGGY